MRAFIFVVLALSSLLSHAQIRGVVNGYYGGEIELMQVVQAVSGGYETVASATISENGAFRFRSEPDPGFYYLKIEDRYTPYYRDAECGGDIILKAPDNLNNKLIPIEIIYPCESGEPRFFHEYVQQWNNDLALFIEGHPAPRRDSLYHAELTAFEKDQLEKLSPVFDQYPYLEIKVNYSIAALKKLAGFPRSELYDRYIKDRPAHIDHADYVTFFAQYYQSKVMHHLRKHNDRYVDSLIAYSGFTAVSNLLKEHELIPRTAHAELAAIVFLYKEELPHLKKNRKKLLLQQAVEDAQTPGVRRTARDILNDMKFLERGSKAPSFTVTDTAGNTIDESFFEGNFTYLQFWSTWNDNAVNALYTLKEIAGDYSNIKFLSISTDRDFEAYYSFIKNSEIQWPTAHYGGDFNFLESYGAASSPMYFLIDKSGRLLISPAEEPSRMLPVFDALEKAEGPSNKPYEIIREYDK